jgi:hypothetical protein
MKRSLRTGDGERLRKQKFSELLHRAWYQALLVLLPCAALVIGAVMQSWPVAIGAPAVLVAGVLIGGRAWAGSAARKQIVSAFAATHGLTFMDEIDPPGMMPLLRAGDERKMTCAMRGPLQGMEVLLAHFTYTDVTYRTDSKGHTSRDEEDHDFTVAMTPVAESSAALPALHLRPRGFLGLAGGWSKGPDLDECETESVRFNERFKAWHAEGQDPMVLRRMLDPSTVDALANHPLDLGVEMCAGHLLVYVEDHLGDSGELQGLVDALALLRGAVFAAARVQPVSAPAPASHGPPGA